MDAMETGLRHRLQRAVRHTQTQHEHLAPLYAELDGAVERGTHAEVQLWLGRYEAALAAHFATEDDVLFPALVGLDAEVTPVVERLVVEHREVIETLARLEVLARGSQGATIAEALAALRDLLRDHERREEALLARVLEPPVRRSRA